MQQPSQHQRTASGPSYAQAGQQPVATTAAGGAPAGFIHVRSQSGPAVQYELYAQRDVQLTCDERAAQRSLTELLQQASLQPPAVTALPPTTAGGGARVPPSWDRPPISRRIAHGVCTPVCAQCMCAGAPLHSRDPSDDSSGRLTMSPQESNMHMLTRRGHIGGGGMMLHTRSHSSPAVGNAQQQQAYMTAVQTQPQHMQLDVGDTVMVSPPAHAHYFNPCSKRAIRNTCPTATSRTLSASNNNRNRRGNVSNSAYTKAVDLSLSRCFYVLLLRPSFAH
jgi:hypothetical protein